MDNAEKELNEVAALVGGKPWGAGGKRRGCEVKITQDTAIQIYIWTFAICFAVTLIGIEIYQSIWGGQ